MNGINIGVYLNPTSVSLIIKEKDYSKTIQLSDQEILEITDAIDEVKKRNKRDRE